MKFLEYTPFARLNSFLNNVNLGECILKGSLEAYSCKLAGQDRKLSHSLEQEVLDYVAQSPDDCSSSPVGPLCSTASRRTLIYLILTLNHMYPDYDFSMVQAHNFFKECVLNNVKQKVENYLLEAAKVWATENGGDTVFLDSIWKAIDEVIDLADCEVFNYMPEFEGDPFMERGAIWSSNLFFYNKKLKRILSFSCCCLSKLAIEDLSANEMLSDEDNIFNDMDME
uniref:Repressor of RNA polymerase III transcription n=1 Tax=Araucaria cunninghamii TaxID=56994 RepID=A0A0D6QRF9_ARACU